MRRKDDAPTKETLGATGSGEEVDGDETGEGDDDTGGGGVAALGIDGGDPRGVPSESSGSKGTEEFGLVGELRITDGVTGVTDVNRIFPSLDRLKSSVLDTQSINGL